MKVDKYIFVINGLYRSQWDWPDGTRYALITNSKSDDSNKFNHTRAYIINLLPKDQWPKSYDNVLLITSVPRPDSENTPIRADSIFIVNYDVIKQMPKARHSIYPDLIFAKCPSCLTEFETTVNSHPFDVYKCPRCGGDVYKSRWEP